ncbi:transposase [Halobacillus salinus]|uniref:transposase n=1 Tax=Halobacillus salinus TaxID=192814 RepID=UPI0009A6522F|nr:transposase [Halobacillus salinus]
MARRPRRKSSVGVYHVMMRGVNHLVIFEDDEDRLRFLSTLARGKRAGHFELYGYCLMDNHVHLLMEEREKDISNCIMRMCASYVYWYNAKHERCGHLFQDRFKSEPVESVTSFLKVLRYIHQNPLNAGLVQRVDVPQWTSYQDYFRTAGLINTEKALTLFSPNMPTARKLFAVHMAESDKEEYLDLPVRIKDSDVMDFLKDKGIEHNSQLQHMNKQERDSILIELKNRKGVSIRQLSRVTGISKSVIGRLGRLGTGTSSQLRTVKTLSKW